MTPDQLIDPKEIKAYIYDQMVVINIAKQNITVLESRLAELEQPTKEDKSSK